MIAKFKCEENEGVFMEVGTLKENKRMTAFQIQNDSGDLLNVKITEENLFDLIGYLLRIQSELKKQPKNV